MKKVFASLLLVAAFAVISCGPSAEEQQAEKNKQDSIANAAAAAEQAAKDAEAAKAAAATVVDSAKIKDSLAKLAAPKKDEKKK